MLKKVKGTYLIHIYDKQCEFIQKKINGRAQTSRFSVFTRGRQELCTENAKKHTENRQTKTPISHFFSPNNMTHPFQLYDLALKSWFLFFNFLI